MMRWLRPETSADHSDIHALLVECFPTDAEARLVDELRTAQRLLVSYVAEIDGQIVGHVAFSPVSTASGAMGVGLAPLSVQQTDRRRGVAADLVTAGLAACRALNCRWSVVLGDPAYYAPGLGFQPASQFGLSASYSGGEAFSKCELQPKAIPRDAGLRFAMHPSSRSSGSRGEIVTVHRASAVAFCAVREPSGWGAGDSISFAPHEPTHVRVDVHAHVTRAAQLRRNPQRV